MSDAFLLPHSFVGWFRLGIHSGLGSHTKGSAKELWEPSSRACQNLIAWTAFFCILIWGAYVHFPRFLHTQDVSLYGWSPQSKSQTLPNPRTNNTFLHTRNQAFPQILSECEVAPKYSLPSPPLPSCFPLLPGAESEITIPRKVVVGTLNSYWSIPQREKLTVKVEKHRPAVASQEMFCSPPLPKAKKGGGSLRRLRPWSRES